MRSRRVVICDQCGAQTDLVWNPYSREMAPPYEDGWTGVFRQREDGGGRADFCSSACSGVWRQTHTPGRVTG
jgi:hypothetical protein